MPECKLRSPGLDGFEPQVARSGADAHRFLFVLEQRKEILLESGIVPERDGMDRGRPDGPIFIAKRILKRQQYFRIFVGTQEERCRRPARNALIGEDALQG